MTRTELICTFITQAQMGWLEEEMEEEASINDVLHMMQVCTILLKAFTSTLPEGDDHGREQEQG